MYVKVSELIVRDLRDEIPDSADTKRLRQLETDAECGGLDNTSHKEAASSNPPGGNNVKLVTFGTVIACNYIGRGDKLMGPELARPTEVMKCEPGSR